MSERVESYTFIDEEGERANFNYISRSCMCSMDCYADEIELFEDGSTIPYRLKIEGSEMKYFVQSLIDGSARPSLDPETAYRG